jgi:hypothetical protein
MHVAMMAPLDTRADRHLRPEVPRPDVVHTALAEDAIAHALALFVAGLDAVDLLGPGPLGRARLLAFRAIDLLRRGLLLLLTLATLCSLLLLALLALSTLPLIALLAFGRLLLIALTPLDLLLLLALAPLGTLDIAFALTLDLLRPLTLRTLDGAPLDPGLAPFHTGSGSLRRCTRGLANGTCPTPAAAAAPARLTILSLGKAGSAGTEQKYAGCRHNHLPVHLDCTPLTRSAGAALRCAPRVSVVQRV